MLIILTFNTKLDSHTHTRRKRTRTEIFILLFASTASSYCFTCVCGTFFSVVTFYALAVMFCLLLARAIPFNFFLSSRLHFHNTPAGGAALGERENSFTFLLPFCCVCQVFVGVCVCVCMCVCIKHRLLNKITRGFD